MNILAEGFELAMQFGDSAKIVKAGRIKGQALQEVGSIAGIN